jgi:hypothetical protein
MGVEGITYKEEEKCIRYSDGEIKSLECITESIILK